MNLDSNRQYIRGLLLTISRLVLGLSLWLAIGYGIIIGCLWLLLREPLSLQVTPAVLAFVVHLLLLFALIAVLFLSVDVLIMSLAHKHIIKKRLALIYSIFLLISIILLIMGISTIAVSAIALCGILGVRLVQEVAPQLPSQPRELGQARRALSVIQVALVVLIANGGLYFNSGMSAPLLVWQVVFLACAMLFGHNSAGRAHILISLTYAPLFLTSIVHLPFGSPLHWAGISGLSPALVSYMALVLGIALNMQAIFVLPRMSGANTLLLILSAGLFISSEGVVRSSPLDVYAKPFGVAGQMVSDDRLGWIAEPLWKIANDQQSSLLGDYLSNTFQLEQGQRLIICLGGSSTEGSDVPSEDRWTARLERELNARGLNCKVLNAGVGGYSSFQLLVLFRDYLKDFRPDLVVVYTGNNDLESKFRSAVTQREWFEMTHGSAYRDNKLKVITWFQRVLAHSHLYNLAVRLSILVRIRLQIGRANSPEEYRRNLDELAQIVHQRGGRVLFVAEATIKKTQQYNAAMSAVASQHNEPYLNIKPVLLRTNEWDDLFQTYCHPNQKGSAEIARILAQLILEQKLLSPSDLR